LGIIDYHSPLNVLISVKGHPYERDAFAAVFESFEGLRHTFIEQPASQALMNPKAAAPWDVLVFYDMPGIDFSTQPPTLVPPPQALKEGFMALLEAGKGMVFLHHAIAGWPLWPEFGEVVGGRFFYLPAECRGQPVLDSGYRHDVEHTVTVLETEHPIVADLPPSFPLKDELYLYEVFKEDISPLLSSNHSFTGRDFYSAHHAVTGNMFCNDKWPHPEGSSLIGWTKTAGASRICYLQPGDGPDTYASEHYRQLLENAIHWAAGQDHCDSGKTIRS
jgi:type 1 glutamine amidotransferase